jgi:hypothetical protein
LIVVITLRVMSDITRSVMTTLSESVRPTCTTNVLKLHRAPVLQGFPHE